MTGPHTLTGRFFDGKSAAAQTVDVDIDMSGLTIKTDGDVLHWLFKHITLSANVGPGKDDGDIRLGNKRDADALLILPHEAFSILHDAAPDIFSGARSRRRLTTLIITLIAGAGVITAGLFWGVPAASGPLAQATPKELEMRIGNNIAAQISTVFKQCGQDDGYDLITPVIDNMAEKGAVGFPIHFRFIRASAPNAFALPGGQVMATSGLLDAVGGDQEAFLAVVAHELGHVRNRDSMKSVYRNAGLGVTLEVITGGSGAAQQAVLVGGQLSQLRYTRQQEAAADDTAAEILNASDLDPAALARAFEAITANIDDNEDRKSIFDINGNSIPTWMRSHPDTQKRIDLARQRARESTEDSLPLSEKAWRIVTQSCSEHRSTDDNRHLQEDSET